MKASTPHNGMRKAVMKKTSSYFLKMRAKPRKAMACGWKNSNKMVGHSQSICYHIKEQKVPVKEQMNFLEKDTTVLL